MGVFLSGVIFPNWEFAPHHPMSKQRDPIQGEFFNTDSIKNAADEIVREAIQNSLDAAVGGLVVVRIFISGEAWAVPADAAAEYFGELKSHAEACGAPVELMNTPCRHVVIEDFGTSGLCGDVSSTEEPPPGQRNDFFYFFRAEGKSGKSGADRGRWGVGKYVFPKASILNTFFGMTTRGADSDVPGPLLMGQAVMRNHKIGDSGYEPDGWWADLVGGIPVPTCDTEVIDRFRKTWHVRRKDEPGMSVIVPYADDSLTVDDLRRSVVRDYFVAILSGALEVQIEAPGIEPISVTAATLDTVIEDLAGDEREQVQRDAALVRWSIPEPANLIALGVTKGYPAWTSESIGVQERASIRDALGEGLPVAVRVPVVVTSKEDDGPRESHFDVLLSPEDDSRRLPLYVREGIIVSEAVQRGAIGGVRAIVTIPAGSLADLLGDAEGPAHTTWSEKTARFRNKYINGAAWLTFVKQAPRRIVEIARESDEQEDRTITADFFSVPDDSAGGARGGSAGPPKPGDKTGKPVVAVSRPRRINVARSGDGFIVTLTENGTGVRSIDVSVAYDRRGGNPFAKWSVDDFDLKSMEVEITGGTEAVREGNRLVVDVTKPDDLKIQLQGFDTNRDLRVNAREVDPNDAN